MNRFKRTQRTLAIKQRFQELRNSRRGYTRSQLWAQAKLWVAHHFGKKATREGKKHHDAEML